MLWQELVHQLVDQADRDGRLIEILVVSYDNEHFGTAEAQEENEQEESYIVSTIEAPAVI